MIAALMSSLNFKRRPLAAARIAAAFALAAPVVAKMSCAWILVGVLGTGDMTVGVLAGVTPVASVVRNAKSTRG